jgi:hypothetical protein
MNRYAKSLVYAFSCAGSVLFIYLAVMMPSPLSLGLAIGMSLLLAIFAFIFAMKPAWLELFLRMIGALALSLVAVRSIELAMINPTTFSILYAAGLTTLTAGFLGMIIL